MEPLAPCLLDRRTLSKVWGGSWLAEHLALEVPGEGPVGETWEAFHRPDGCSRVRGGPLAGATLAELMDEHGEALLGPGVPPGPDGRFPLLLKFVDTAAALSVQVHPGDEQGRAGGDGGKTEAWLVVHVGPGGWICRGLKQTVGRGDVEKALEHGGWEDLLVRFQPRVGDVVFLPAGTVHSLGPGVTVFEIQQNSDLTYRLHDWGRTAAAGARRPLHPELALAAARFGEAEETTHPASPAGEGASWLVRCEHFALRRLEIRRPCALGTEGRCKLLTVLEGLGTLGWRSGGSDAPLFMERGATVLVPASTGTVFVSPVGTMDLLVSEPGRAW